MSDNSTRFKKGHISWNSGRRVDKICQTCQKHYTVPKNRIKSKYCSKPCLSLYYNKFGVGQRILELHLSGKNVPEIMEITGKKYSHVLSTINRKKFRTTDPGESYTANIVRLKKNKSCLICNETRVLDACHIIPACEGGDISEENILVLCPTHHRLFDKNKLNDQEYNMIKDKVEKRHASGQ